MNRTLKKYSYLNRTIDVSVVWFSWMLAYFFKFEWGTNTLSHASYGQRYLGYGVLLTLTSMIVFKNSKLYDQIGTGFAKDVLKILKANTLAFTIFLVLAFFSSEERLSRIALFLYLTFSTSMLVIVRVFFRNKMLSIPVKFAFVGDGKSTRDYFHLIKDLPQYTVTHWFDPPEDLKKKFPDQHFSKSFIESEKFDGVIIGFDTDKSQMTNTYLDQLSDSIISIMVLPDVSYAKLGFALTNFKGIPVIHINEPDVKTFGIILKRIFDLLSCGLGMLLISPLLILLGVLVKLSSNGPIFYGQVRMGVDGREFKMWKFRSMVVGEANQEGWTVKDDPRVTKLGKFMRQTSLDELPQLWNVVVGDMSLVGPRPERPVYVNKFREEIPSYMLRHKFKAGITGWAQVNGWRGDTSIEKRIECDLWYIKNWTLWLDFSIIFLTFWKGFVNKNAY